jgi:hypothetical protein
MPAPDGGACRFPPVVEREALAPPRLRIDLRVVPCATVLSYAGAYQLTLETTVAELAVELHSYDLGQRQAGFIATSHLARIAGQGPRVFCAPAGEQEKPVGERRRDCLIDHLDQLSVFIAGATGGAVVIDVAEETLRRMDETSPLNSG